MTRRALALLMAVVALSGTGCASFGRGVTEALIGRDDKKKDTETEPQTRCYIRGQSFDGLEASMVERQNEMVGGTRQPILKLLMIHGIGDHQPGYATRLSQNLARELGLNRTAKRYRQFTLKSASAPDLELGRLRVNRFENEDGSRKLLFYELTWDDIVAVEKETIAYDNHAEQSFRRAGINDAMKKFVNSTVPDVLMYNGTSGERIRASVGAAMCFMFSREWDSLPLEGEAACTPEDAEYLAYTLDNYAIITHSLGSRVGLDALQRIAEVAAADPVRGEELRNRLSSRRLPVFMLSNQLPLLQLGQDPPEVRGQIAEICGPEAPLERDRLFAEVEIIAFSDPNDVMSYPVPPGFVDEHVDSRICPNLTNIVVNVAKVLSFPVVGEVANPMTAHTGYDDDEVVLGLMTRGLGTDYEAPAVSDQCEWLETF